MSTDHAPLMRCDAGQSSHDDSGAITRTGLLKMIGAGAAGAVGLTLLSDHDAFAAAPKSKATDVAILQYALTLEYLGASFYEAALKGGKLSGKAKQIATVFAAQERQHVTFVKQTITKLGSKPHAEQTFDFGSALKSQSAFLMTSATVEMLCVETLNGAAPLVTKPVLIGAAELVSVEARHVSWVLGILGENAAPDTFTPALTATASQAAVKKLGFVKGGLS
jgi:hypothetical protein